MSGAQQPTEPRPSKPAQCVRVTAADFNGSDFDGSPFSDVPMWLRDAMNNRKIVLHTRGGTDYAQWEVTTKLGVVNAGPGDWIVRNENAELTVCPHEMYKFAHSSGIARGREGVALILEGRLESCKRADDTSHAMQRVIAAFTNLLTTIRLLGEKAQ